MVATHAVVAGGAEDNLLGRGGRVERAIVPWWASQAVIDSIGSVLISVSSVWASLSFTMVGPSCSVRAIVGWSIVLRRAAIGGRLSTLVANLASEAFSGALLILILAIAITSNRIGFILGALEAQVADRVPGMLTAFWAFKSRIALVIDGVNGGGLDIGAVVVSCALCALGFCLEVERVTVSASRAWNGLS